MSQRPGSDQTPMREARQRPLGRTVGALAFVLALFALLSPGDFYTNFATRILIAAIFALSLDLLVGHAGLISLGHATFSGLVAYLVAWLTVRQGWSHLPAAALALSAVACAAAAFGALALRAAGIGFLMITLALGQIAWGLAHRWTGVTGGDNGISGVTRPAPFGIDLDPPLVFYGVVAAAFLAVLWGCGRLLRSPFGASLRGTRDQPRRMGALGYDVWLIRWSTFVLAGLLAGLAGLLDVYFHKFISPYSLSLAESAMVLLMVIVGGSATLLGPVLGAALVLLFIQIVSGYVERWTGALGVLFLVIVMFMPKGVLPGLARLLEPLSRAPRAGRERLR